MKLLFVSNLFPDAREPQRGLDNATLLGHLANHMEIRVVAVRPVLPWSARGWQCRDEDLALSPNYVPAPYVPKIGSACNHLLMARALRPALQKLRVQFPFDAVLASWLYPDTCAVVQIAREQGFPFAAIAQGSDVHQYFTQATRRRIMLEHLPAAKAVITRSAELARLLTAAGMPTERVCPIYNGVDTTLFAPGDQTAARQKLCLPTDGKIVLFVGNFYSIKNPLLLLDAHARLRTDPAFSNCHLVMLGGGPLEDKARACAAGSGSVHFVGRQKPAEVASYLQAADLLAVPSRNEGVPNVILEAFACGKPVVATKVGGIPEVLTHDFLGRLVEPQTRHAFADGLRAVLSTTPDTTRVVKYAQQFSWQRATAAYLEVLRKLA